MKVVAEFPFFDLHKPGEWVRVRVPRGRAARVVVDRAGGWTSGAITVKGALSPWGTAADFDSGAVSIAASATGGRARIPASDLHDYDEIEIEKAANNGGGGAATCRVRVLVEDEGAAPAADVP